MRAAVVVVGDEILSGHVRDANGHFIATRLAAHGHRLAAIAVVPDDPEAIAEAVRREASRCDLVFVCGGVGPTHDDRTMEGVAAAAGVALAVCEPIARRVEALAERLAGEGVGGDHLGIEGLRKMALAPAGAEALATSAGWIPAVVLPVAQATAVVLPGPPRELEVVFRDAVEPRYLAGTGDAVVREEIRHLFPESAVARLLDDLERAHDGVAIGSYPMEGFSLVRVTGRADAVAVVAAEVRARIEALERSDEGRRLLDLYQGSRRREQPAE